jgi:hypothetical protein
VKPAYATRYDQYFGGCVQVLSLEDPRPVGVLKLPQ